MSEGGKIYENKLNEIRGMPQERIVTQEAVKRISHDMNIPDDLDQKSRESLIGTEIFRRVAKQEPKGYVCFKPTVFGVVLCVGSDEDLKALRKKEDNIGGFYRHRQSVVSGQSTVNFPLMAIHAKTLNNDIFRHEDGHAVNRSLFQVLSNITRDGRDIDFEKWNNSDWVNRWGGKKETEWPEKPIKNKASLERYLKRQALPYAYRMAKDEVLADFVATGNLSYVKYLVEQDGLYNYIYDEIKDMKSKGLIDMSPNDY